MYGIGPWESGKTMVIDLNTLPCIIMYCIVSKFVKQQLHIFKYDRNKQTCEMKPKYSCSKPCP